MAHPSLEKGYREILPMPNTLRQQYLSGASCHNRGTGPSFFKRNSKHIFLFAAPGGKLRERF